MHITYRFHHMEDAFQLLEASVISQPQPSITSHNSPSIQPSFDEVVNPIPSLVDKGAIQFHIGFPCQFR